MGEGSTDSAGEGGAKRRRVRVRVKEPGSDTIWRRARDFYTQHRAWLVPVVILVLGTVTIWLAMMLYIGE
jgi:hypothetical protein